MFLILVMLLKLNADVLIPTPSANSFEFKSHLYNTDLQNFTTWYLKNRTHLDEELLIIELFNQAQEYYLSGDFNQAKNTYLKVINMEHDKDWKKPQRDLIVDSYKQIIKLTDNKQPYQIRLQAYSNSYEINTLKHSSITFEPKYLENWQSILINGVHYDLKDVSRLKFYNTLYRWTLLSNKASPYTLVATPQNFFSKNYPSTYFYSDSSSCEFSISNSLTMEHQVFAGDDCVTSPKKNTNQAVNKDLPSPKLNALTTSQPLKSPHWYKSKWFWAGVTALTGFLIYNNQRGSSDSAAQRPTHTEGF